MHKKFYIVLIFILLLQGCGYTPMHSSKLDSTLEIEIINLDGDNDLNNFIKQKINRISKTEDNNKFLISISSNYSRETQAKDKTGNTTQYSLNADVIFIVQINGTQKEISFSEKSTMNKFDDEFEQSNYERSFKQNISQIFVNKLVIYLSRIK